MLTEQSKQTLAELLTHYPPDRKASAVLFALYLAQRDYGYVTLNAAREVAGLLDMDPTEVMGVAGFYSLLHTEPVGKYVIDYCNDLPCALRGSGAMLKKLEAKLGIQPGETTPDGLFTLNDVMCIGACHRAPCMQVNLEFQEFLTEEKLDQILAALRAGEAPGFNMATEPVVEPWAPVGWTEESASLLAEVAEVSVATDGADETPPTPGVG
ncbi:MAG: NAD(P)H-dependent oxidoreductase subunit E [Anaerolineae bacterium]